ncbi:hypothetical protein F4821DRAFT_229404 [Hypoxylon rubiginosum]|uniref:Uncharacterized protein n=1 Tax=Hypoxylon rubiginosum TaxID=110542 RepID=A0ACC0DD32_9PEZI|nr:hypothetical protein F4821DRAFT_229404 [Hypoxylon rubiginosum]
MDYPLEEQDAYWDQDNRNPPMKVKLKRASVACNRCRRLRTKCNHRNARPPCESCATAGAIVAAECIFSSRGQGGNERNVRQKGPRQRAREHCTTSHNGPFRENIEQLSPGAPVFTPETSVVLTPKSASDLLPPFSEVIEGCRTFITSYYQIGFIPKALFLERLKKPQRKDRFFLYSILSVSARFTPSLVQRYGGGLRATETFIDLASQYGIQETFKPTVENIQAFYLLGLAEWGSGDRNRSSIHMGIAVKMATILHLHREETFHLPVDASSDAIIEAEVARRTFWVIQGQENLHSGHNVPKSFCPEDITALLPCEENDFAFGIFTTGRAALDGTPPAMKDPSLINTPSRSLSAALIQVQNLWGRVARGAYRTDGDIHEEPWNPDSYYSKLSTALRVWGDNLAPKHRWSVWNFRGYKTEGLHLAYLSLVMVFRLCNIVLRRLYLSHIIESISRSADASGAPPEYWQNVAHELFTNVFELHEQITAFITTRSQEEGFPTEIVFCVYICGSLAAYLWKWPQLYPSLAVSGESVLQQSLDVLKQLHYDWPMSKRWEDTLSRMTSALSAMGSSPPTTFTSWENGVVAYDRMRHERRAAKYQQGHESELEATSIVAADTATIESEQEFHMQEMERVKMGADNEDSSTYSTDNMGFYQFDSFESDLLVALANGDTQFGLPL